MPQRSKVDLLPQEIKEELNQRLHSGSFSDYAGLTDWLEARCAEAGLGDDAAPSKTALHKYGRQFQERCEMLRASTQQAVEMKRILGDEEAEVTEMSLQMAQSLMFNLMVERGEDLSPKEMSLLTRAIADASRGSISVKKFQAEVKKRAEVAATEADEALKREGISDETAALIRSKFLGLAG